MPRLATASPYAARAPLDPLFSPFAAVPLPLPLRRALPSLSGLLPCPACLPCRTCVPVRVRPPFWLNARAAEGPGSRPSFLAAPPLFGQSSAPPAGPHGLAGTCFCRRAGPCRSLRPQNSRTTRLQSVFLLSSFRFSGRLSARARLHPVALSAEHSEKGARARSQPGRVPCPWFYSRNAAALSPDGKKRPRQDTRSATPPTSSKTPAEQVCISSGVAAAAGRRLRPLPRDYCLRPAPCQAVLHLNRPPPQRPSGLIPGP